MTETVELSNGIIMPGAGFGTWEIAPDSLATKMVTAALKTGYRLIDTAKIYDNEKAVGEALRTSKIDRRELFISTKVWNDDQGYDRTIKAFTNSLQALDLDYLDLYLIHWPATQLRHESWRAFETLYNEGRAKAVGVCNYTFEHLWSLLERSELIPMVNQVEFHPFIYKQQRKLLDFCHQQGIIVQAYSPLSRISKENVPPTISGIARRLGKSPQQIILRWCIQHGTVPLSRSTNPVHIRSNFEVFDFELTPADMKALDSLSDGRRVGWDPADMAV